MVIETRQIVTVEEIQGIELKCPKHDCGGILCIDLRPGCINTEEQCPRCKRTWWTAKQRSTVLELLKALTNSRHARNEGPDAPTITMILPEPADSGT